MRPLVTHDGNGADGSALRRVPRLCGSGIDVESGYRVSATGMHARRIRTPPPPPYSPSPHVQA
ncbi:hypothetical protein STRIP9103_06860 [Streptomyces ipomoeae 91-03]|uniref:Uncharacterized protein n=1 Tax=Streptomyces ipomoeae 91-03 TaxID=698759 RepID=L1L082_9ACTN|nr:hypothetical protein STRIP9103_06860 [Streptomyces ipomoeae 91-03]